MSTECAPDAIARALFGGTRRALLGLFFGHPQESFYLREIVRRTRSGQGAAQRELARLTRAGILTRTRKANVIHYQANARCPVFPELRGLALKTTGLADVLRGALESVAGAVDCVFIYGSQANGSAKAQSDVDVLVVGDVDPMSLHRAFSEAEERLARPVNYTLLSRAEFTRRRREKGSFLARILAGEKILLLGAPDDLR